MASPQVRQLATRLRDDVELRGRFRADPKVATKDAGIALSSDEFHALDAVDWGVMSDDELLVRLRGAEARGTH